MNISFHHVSLSVTNIENSINFYMRVLSAEVKKRYDDAEVSIALLQVWWVFLELFSFVRDQYNLPEYRKKLWSDLHTVWTKHFAFTSNEYEQLRDHIIRCNVEIEQWETVWKTVSRYMFFKDPDGILWEILEE